MLAEKRAKVVWSFASLFDFANTQRRNVSRRVLLEQMIPNHDYILLCIILAWSGIGDIDVQHCQFRVTLFLFTNFVLLLFVVSFTIRSASGGAEEGLKGRQGRTNERFLLCVRCRAPSRQSTQYESQVQAPQAQA